MAVVYDPWVRTPNADQRRLPRSHFFRSATRHHGVRLQEAPNVFMAHWTFDPGRLFLASRLYAFFALSPGVIRIASGLTASRLCGCWRRRQRDRRWRRGFRFRHVALAALVLRPPADQQRDADTQRDEPGNSWRAGCASRAMIRQHPPSGHDATRPKGRGMEGQR